MLNDADAPAGLLRASLGLHLQSLAFPLNDNQDPNMVVSYLPDVLLDHISKRTASRDISVERTAILWKTSLLLSILVLQRKESIWKARKRVLQCVFSALRYFMEAFAQETVECRAVDMEISLRDGIENTAHAADCISRVRF